MSTPRKEKPCKVCKSPFMPSNPLQRVCGIKCAIDHAVSQRTAAGKKAEAAERKALREAKAKAKTRGQWMKEAQREFNAFIRARDKGRPCICCGSPLKHGAVGGGFDCGHYRSVGSAPHLRFDERNAHGQRKQCNRYGAGRAVDYRIGLIARIGLEAVESIEADQATKKYTVDDLRKIKAEYTAKTKQIKENMRSTT